MTLLNIGLKIKRYIINVLLWLDLGANTLLGGDPQETLSSRLGKAAKRGNRIAYVCCRALRWFDKNHCINAIDKDEGDKSIWRW